MADLDIALRQFAEKRPQYEKARAYYENEVGEAIANSYIARLVEKTGKRFRFPFASIVVDSVLNRLEIMNVSVINDEAATKALQQVWRDNDMDLESIDQHRWALVYGEDYLFAWPVVDDQNNVVAVDLCFNDPMTTQIVYDSENPRKKKFGARMWVEADEDGKPKTRVDLLYPKIGDAPGYVEKYISRGKRAQKSTDFIQYNDTFDENDEPVWPVENEYGLPIFHFRTQRPNGVPEHKRAYAPQDRINKILANMSGLEDYTALPQRYVTTKAGTGQATTQADEDFPDASSNSNNAGAAPALQSRPGGVWWLDNVENVGQLAPGDVSNMLEPYRQHIEDMAMLTQTPIHNFRPGGNEPSGESLRVRNQPLNKKVDIRKRSFGRTWQEVGTFVLELFGFTDVIVVISWAPVESNMDQDFWTVVKQKIDAGVPPQRALEEAGYDVEVVKQWFADPTYTPTQLQAFADALQKLAAAVEMKMLSPEKAMLLIPETFRTAPADMPPNVTDPNPA